MDTRCCTANHHREHHPQTTPAPAQRADNRTLDERLKAARSNLRFQDRRITDFETGLADPRTVSRHRGSVAWFHSKLSYVNVIGTSSA